MPTSRLTVFSLVVIALSLIVAPALAQETTGNLEGWLVDADGEPISFANVNVTSPSLQGGRGVMSTSEGYFGIFKLPVGIYTVKISHVSYHEANYEEVSIRLGRTTTLGKISLTSKTFEAPAIVVTGKKKLLDPNAATIGTGLSSGEFEQLPIDRDYKDMTILLPHANESFLGDEANYAGGTGQGNKYFVDGVEVTDPYLGLTGTNLPYNFLKEVSAKTGGYEAAYRSSLGGIVNVISHSGGNEFHGQAFGFFVNNQFAGDSRAPIQDPRTGDFAQYDAGFSLGGPIKKDKLWFFAAYNSSVSSEDVEIPGQGVYEDKSVSHIFAGKLDWKVGPRSTASLTVMGDPTTRDAVGELFGTAGTPTGFDNPDPFLVDMETGGVNVLARGSHMFSDRFILESSASVITRKLKMIGATERGRNETLFVETLGVFSGGYLSPTDDRSVQITADVRATFVAGRHTLKSGIEFRDNKLDFFEEFKAIWQESDSLYTAFTFSAVDGTVRNRIPSAYLQDSWRMTDRLLVNAGLRWDGQFLYGTDGEVAQKILDQWQPRVGVVYQPGELGSQKAFGSYGRYYHELGLALSILKHNEELFFEVIDYDHDPRVDPSGGVSYIEHATIQEEVDDLEGQYYDEFTLGYERQIGETFTAGVRGIYRTLGAAIEDGVVGNEFLYGNPGKGDLSEYPEAARKYRALEFTLQAIGGERYNGRASYVLSRTRGNYPGLFDSDTGIVFSNAGAPFDTPEQATNSYGLLPNDRTHVVKLSGSYRVGWGLTTGGSFTWMTGTPLSVYNEDSRAMFPGLAQPRGSAGRTPDIWDLNFRFVYDLAYALETSTRPRLILDLFHVGSQREAVAYDEVGVSDPTVTPFIPTRYQPPTAMRLGVEVDF